MILGAPFDGGTSYRPGTRFGPQAIRMTDYLAARRLAPVAGAAHRRAAGPARVDAGDVEMYSGDIEARAPALRGSGGRGDPAGAIPLVLGGDHTIA